MPTELNRIKELAGLQQEAAAISPNQIEAFKKWYDTYSKMQSKDVYNYAKGIFKAYMETGVTELDGASKQDPKGKAYDDLAKIFPGMDGDIEAIGHQLKSQGVDPLDMEAAEESAVAEAPASGDQALANELSSYFAKLAKEMLQNMQRPNTNDVEYEEFVDIAQAFKGGIQAGLDEVNLSGFEFSSNPFGDFGRSINDGPDEELVKILAKYGYRPGPDGDNDEATIVKQQEESAVQPTPVLNAVKETPAISQVDEAIKKATAQLKSFSNFDGLKPYKPKKK